MLRNFTKPRRGVLSSLQSTPAPDGTFVDPKGVQWGNTPPETLLDKFPLQMEGSPITPQGPSTLPEPPPTVKPRSTNPFGKENLSQTLLDIGSSFLSSDNFFEGLGGASRAVSGRMDDLRKTGKTEYGGPDNQFEIITDREGNRTVRKVPEFAEAVEAKRKASNAPDAKTVVDLRSRAIHAISQLPQEQRADAYADLMTNPGRYGGIDTSGMPAMWDDRFSQVMGGMGQTVNQSVGTDFRNQQFEHRKAIDSAKVAQGAQRIGQAERRLNAPPSKRGGGKASTKPPAGFIWDN